MPSEDVSDLRDVVDAINKLCDTMKTSYEDRCDVREDRCDVIEDDCNVLKDRCDFREVEELIEPSEVVFKKVETYVAEKWTDRIENVESVEEIEPIRSHVTEEKMTFSSDQTKEVELIQSHVTEELMTISSDQIEVESIRSHVTEELMTLPSDQIEIEPIRSYVMEELMTFPSDQIEEGEPIRSHVTEELMTFPSDQIEEGEPIRSHATEELMTLPSDQIEEVETVVSDSELVMQCEPTSEMYYTASSEVSLLSDMDVQDRLGPSDDKRRDDRNSVIAGHVAAMREHFESMTRTNTPCPDQLRSCSPSIEVFRTVTNSPDN